MSNPVIPRASTELTAFNARWMSPEEVARNFVPTHHLLTLLKTQNSLLLGPRGCGKTTLLKMLTRGAQMVWLNERLRENPALNEYPSPDFEAIYVPSDVRWSYELNSVNGDLRHDPVLSERVQRASVSLAALFEVVGAFRQLLRPEAVEKTQDFLALFIQSFRLKNTVPAYSDIRLSLLGVGDAIRSSIVRRDPAHLQNIVDDLNPVLTGRAADSLIRACRMFMEFFPRRLPGAMRWALCFDELEIAPKWLQNELLESLRSSDQQFLFKLTWSPVLPINLRKSSRLQPERDEREKQQQQQHDYAAIPMWNAHASESKNVTFCKRFSSHFIRNKFPHQNLSPRDIFGASVFAQEEAADENTDAYAKGTPIWYAMVELAQRDSSFKDFLLAEGLDPANPVSDQVRKRDECLRKIKPIVLLRETYRGALRTRSRKAPHLYAGEEAIYAISEGNPRLLARLLNDLLDSAFARPNRRNRLRISKTLQANVLSTASKRSIAEIRTYPTQSNIGSAHGKFVHLSSIIETLGQFMYRQLVEDAFPVDPVGSFVVDNGVSPAMLEEISRGLLTGAFIAVGGAGEVPSSILGARIRLSYMLAPYYGLLFRNYRQIRLSTALKPRIAGHGPLFLETRISE